MFASLLPHEIGRTLESMAADTLHYSIRSTGHDDVTEVKVTRMAAGNMTDAEMTYVFDNARNVLHGKLIPADSAGGIPLEGK